MKFNVSPYNYSEQVVSKFNFPPDKKVIVSDFTLAKIHQTPGHSLTPKDAFDIASKLDETGASDYMSICLPQTIRHYRTKI